MAKSSAGSYSNSFTYDYGSTNTPYSASSPTTKRLKKSLRQACRTVWLLTSVIIFPLMIYVSIFSTVAVQEGFPVVTQLLAHAQRLEWGFLYVKGYNDENRFILDWREAAYNTQSLRGHGWNAQTWLSNSGEREIVLSSFGISILSFMVCLVCSSFTLLYIYQKYQDEGPDDYYLLLNYHALATTAATSSVCLILNSLLVTYMVVSGYRSLVDQPGSHVFFGPGFAALLILVIIQTVCFVVLHTASRDLDRELKKRQKLEMKMAMKNGNSVGGRSVHYSSSRGGSKSSSSKTLGTKSGSAGRSRSHSHTGSNRNSFSNSNSGTRSKSHSGGTSKSRSRSRSRNSHHTSSSYNHTDDERSESEDNYRSDSDGSEGNIRETDRSESDSDNDSIIKNKKNRDVYRKKVTRTKREYRVV